MTLISLALISLLVAPLQAQLRSEAPLIVLPRGTPVPLSTTSEISSTTHKQGDRFALEVVADVLADGKIAIPRGARGVGEVTDSTTKGMFGRPGAIELRLLYVTVGEQQIRLDGTREEKGSDATLPAAASVMVSSIIGLLITGKSATIPSGSKVTGYVHRDLRLAPAN